MAAKLEIYEVNINGIRHTMQMNAEDAERIGATRTDELNAPVEADAEAEGDVQTKEAKAPANK